MASIMQENALKLKTFLMDMIMVLTHLEVCLFSPQLMLFYKEYA